MIRTLRRRRRDFASVVLGLWLFALGVAFAHACGLDRGGDHGARALAGESQAAQTIPSSSCDDGASQACCRQDTLAAKLQPLIDPPGGQSFAPIAFVDSSSLGASAAPLLQRLPSAHRASDVPLTLRYARLTL
jgi:hypothetical protein